MSPVSPWLQCHSRQGAPITILAIPQHCQDCLLVILVHPVLAVKVEGVAAEGAAKDVIKLVIKQALWEKQDRPRVTPVPLGNPCPSMSPVALPSQPTSCPDTRAGSPHSQDTECDELDDPGASVVHPHLTPGGRRSPKPRHCILLPLPTQCLRTTLGREEDEDLKGLHDNAGRQTSPCLSLEGTTPLSSTGRIQASSAPAAPRQHTQHPDGISSTQMGHPAPTHLSPVTLPSSRGHPHSLSPHGSMDLEK